MGNGNVKRYIGGKRPLKYFKEDVWPTLEIFLTRLGIEEGKGFELFNAFSRIDTDQSGKVSVKECMVYFGGTITRFTERIFDVVDVTDRDGLEFRNFVFALWNFSTLYTVLIAK
jgi:Ca2+-binding EF-hand superfamily protein